MSSTLNLNCLASVWESEKNKDNDHNISSLFRRLRTVFMNVHELARRYRLQNSPFFSQKSGARFWRAQSARASHAYAHRACVWGERERERKEKDCIFSVSPQPRSLFSASFQTLCFTARTCLNTQKYGLSCSLARLWSIAAIVFWFCFISYCCSKQKWSTIILIAVNVANLARFVTT